MGVGEPCFLWQQLLLFPALSPTFSMRSSSLQLHNQKKVKSRPLELWLLLKQNSTSTFPELHLERQMHNAARSQGHPWLPGTWEQSPEKGHCTFQMQRIQYAARADGGKEEGASRAAVLWNPYFTKDPPSFLWAWKWKDKKCQSCGISPWKTIILHVVSSRILTRASFCFWAIPHILPSRKEIALQSQQASYNIRVITRPSSSGSTLTPVPSSRISLVKVAMQ